MGYINIDMYRYMWSSMLLVDLEEHGIVSII